MKTFKKPNQKYADIFIITGNRNGNLGFVFVGNMSLVLFFLCYEHFECNYLSKSSAMFEEYFVNPHDLV